MPTPAIKSIEDRILYIRGQRVMPTVILAGFTASPRSAFPSGFVFKLTLKEAKEVHACEQASVYVVRAFVRMRSITANDSMLAARVDELEQKCDARFRHVFDAIRQLMAPPVERRAIGFIAGRRGRRK